MRGLQKEIVKTKPITHFAKAHDSGSWAESSLTETTVEAS